MKTLRIGRHIKCVVADDVYDSLRKFPYLDIRDGDSIAEEDVAKAINMLKKAKKLVPVALELALKVFVKNKNNDNYRPYKFKHDCE